MPTPTPDTLGEFIAEERKRAGFGSQEQLAERLTAEGCRCSPQAVGHWERNRRKPRWETFLALAKVFGWPDETANQNWRRASTPAKAA